MPRPIPPARAWQAIAAFGGLFTLFSALADPVDLWRITVHSHQGQPLHAVATLESLPGENITDACLSLGTEADSPGSEAPLLQQASLKLNASGTAVEIRTSAPVSSPTLELVLRVQCPGTFLHARHFSVLIPPATAAIAAERTGDGFRLKVAPGETLAGLAAAVVPGDRRRQRQLMQQVVAGNPGVFPDGKPGPVPAGTVLWFPDLRKVAAAGPASLPPAPGEAAPAATVEAPPPPATLRPKPAPRAARGAIALRQALDLGAKPGVEECRMLMPLCGVLEQAGPPPIPKEIEARANGLESGMQALRLRQDSIDSQLARLEQSLADLKRVVESQPAAAAPVPPPKPEIRTVVKTEYRTEPIPWYYWVAIALLVLLTGAGGFYYGRKRAFGESLAESDSHLDAILASAASEMRELDRPVPAAPRVPPAPPAPPVPRPVEAESLPVEPPAAAEVPDAALDTQVLQATTPGLDLELDNGAAGAPSGESVPALTTDLAFEMDQALDNTRSMFTDVDRFIALGRIQNALSLLQFQVVKDPKDRDSWIKLLAIYRQEKMETELEKALREFRRNFPDDKAGQPR